LDRSEWVEKNGLTGGQTKDQKYLHPNISFHKQKNIYRIEVCEKVATVGPSIQLVASTIIDKVTPMNNLRTVIDFQRHPIDDLNSYAQGCRGELQKKFNTYFEQLSDKRSFGKTATRGPDAT
tara:strand:- start:148 stop:513 length:366 start_codon:yes stop_codon:yes gene_type:complete